MDRTKRYIGMAALFVLKKKERKKKKTKTKRTNKKNNILQELANNKYKCLSYCSDGMSIQSPGCKGSWGTT